jgi:DNA-binding IclR family transcriptional regulator
MAAETGLHRASVYRILRTMEHELFLGLDPRSGRYHLGPAMYPAAYLTQTDSELVRLAHPHIGRLAERTGETANLAVDFDGRVVIIDEVLTSHVYKPKLPIGMATSDLKSSHAKLFLAFKTDAQRRKRIEAERASAPNDFIDSEALIQELDIIRAGGVAYDLQSMVGVCAISVPVYDQFGALRASLAVVAPAERFGDEQMKTCLALGRAEASELSQDLGYKPSDPEVD